MKNFHMHLVLPLKLGKWLKEQRNMTETVRHALLKTYFVGGSKRPPSDIATDLYNLTKDLKRVKRQEVKLLNGIKKCHIETKEIQIKINDLAEELNYSSS